MQAHTRDASSGRGGAGLTPSCRVAARDSWVEFQIQPLRSVFVPPDVQTTGCLWEAGERQGTKCRGSVFSPACVADRNAVSFYEPIDNSWVRVGVHGHG